MPRNAARHDFAIIGLGRFGTSLALQLSALGHSVLAIDQNRDLVQQMADELTQTVAMDSTDEDALRSVGIDEFQTVVVAIGSNFENSILTTSLLKEMGIPRVICKALTERQKAILLRVGADQVVLPEHEAGRRLARQLTSPGVIEELELGPDQLLAQVRCPPALAGHSLAELSLPTRLGVSVLLIIAAGLSRRPGAGDVLNEGDILLVLASEEGLARLPTWRP